MTHRRNNKNNKRQRNKSSPQTTQDCKKYRSQSVEDIAEAESESDISDLSSSAIDNSSHTTMAATNQEQISMDSAQSSDHSQVLSTPHAEQSSAEQSSLHLNALQMDTPPPPPPFLSQPMMGANMGPHMGASMYMPTTSPMNMNFPQQMLNFASQMQHAPQTSILSDEDVPRVALQMKALLKEDIDNLIDARVALHVEPLKLELAAANTSIAELQQKVKLLTKQQDDLEQYSRKSCVRVSGIKETANEDVNALVLGLANHVEADINLSDIVAAHRLGEENSEVDTDAPRNVPNRKRCRDIIVKFSNFDARYKLLNGRAKLHEEKSKVFINEELTRTRRSLAYE